MAIYGVCVWHRHTKGRGGGGRVEGEGGPHTAYCLIVVQYSIATVWAMQQVGGRNNERTI